MKINSGVPHIPSNTPQKSGDKKKPALNGFDKVVQSKIIDNNSLREVVEKLKVRIKSEGLKGEEVPRAIITEVLSPHIKKGISEDKVRRLVDRIYDALKHDPLGSQWLRKFRALISD